MTLSTDERLFIRRALGLDRDRVAKRNHYTARAGREIVIGDGLVERGLARRVLQQSPISAVAYTITLKGFHAARERGESIADNELGLMKWREACA